MDRHAVCFFAPALLHLLPLQGQAGGYGSRGLYLSPCSSYVGQMHARCVELEMFNPRGQIREGFFSNVVYLSHVY